jgi:hypothetical protein
MRIKPVALALSLALLAPLVAACSDFDMDKLDVFHLNEKKKLPGVRQELFPGGVPGVSNGVPPELVKGYQAPPLESASAETEPPKTKAEAEPAKPKPKPHVAKRTPAKPKATPAQRPAQAPQPQQAQDTAWPAPQQQQSAQQPWPSAPPQQQQTGANAPWPSAPQQPSAWPTAPAPGTFQKQ